MDKKYWEEYYKSQNPANFPSNFAEYCSNIYDFKKNGSIYDIGCGNGRDSIYFSSKLIPTFGIEQSAIAVKNNIKKISAENNNIKFLEGDFTIYNYDLNPGNYSIYSRFTLHAINYDEEKNFLHHIFNLKKLKKLFIEVRTINDDLYGEGIKISEHEYITSHYRRFIDPKILKKQLEPYFKFDFFEENRGFSKTQNDDPVLLRIVCSKK